VRPELGERWSEPRHQNSEPPRRRRPSRLVRFVAIAFALSLAPVVIYRAVNPPLTPLMLMRKLADGEPIRMSWVPLQRIPPALVRAVIASEDEKFCHHHGFDWVQMGEAWRRFKAGHRARGASTISQQTAKNVFLWPGRSIVRKGIEAYLTVLIELFWSKPRIIEVYLNVIEWGHGIYGADAAAHAYFGKPASALTAQEAALLAAVLPNPRRLSAQRPSAYVDERAATIRERMPGMAVPGVRGCS